MIIIIAQYYFNLTKIEFYTVNNDYLYIKQHMEIQFREFCKNGNLDNIKQLINSHKINIHSYDEYGFRWACFYGRKHIAGYLINLYKNDNKYAIINIHARDELGFRWACKNGQGKERLRLSFAY